MLSCTFAGHRDVYRGEAGAAVEAVLLELLERDSEFCFYTGEMGRFDEMCAQAVRKLRAQSPGKRIKLILVEPYMKQRINTEGEWLRRQFDDIIIPEELLGVHYKAAIEKRNQWMIDQSQYLIAYVRRNFGGAAKAAQYAVKHGVNIVRI